MTPKQIKTTREKAGITQAQAAKLVRCQQNVWQKWESGNYRMPERTWELFLLKLPTLGKEISRTNIYGAAGEHHPGESIEKPYRTHDTIKETSLVEAAREDIYLHTIVITTLGCYVETYDQTDIDIAACEDGALTELGGSCECGYHRYNRLDDDIGQGGWYLP